MSRRQLGVLVVLAALSAGPIVWFVHLSLVYALVPVACRTGSDASIHGATAAAVVLLVLTAVVADRSWRRGRQSTRLDQVLARRPVRDRGPRSETASTPARAGGGVLLAAVLAVYFALIVAMTGAVPLVVDRCG